MARHETKMRDESRKILGIPDLAGHHVRPCTGFHRTLDAIHVEFERPLDHACDRVLKQAPAWRATFQRVVGRRAPIPTTSCIRRTDGAGGRGLRCRVERQLAQRRALNAGR